MADDRIPPRREYARQYYLRNRIRFAEANHERKKQLRILILTHYGNGKLACLHCGIDDLRALTLDHIDGGGSQHRDQLGRRGYNYYYWLRDNGFPQGYQTLCLNCQMIKRFERGEFAYARKSI